MGVGEGATRFSQTNLPFIYGPGMLETILLKIELNRLNIFNKCKKEILEAVGEGCFLKKYSRL